MKQNLKRNLMALLGALLLGLAAIGAAQTNTAQTDTASTAVVYTYDISQFGQTLGQTTMGLQRGPNGYTTDSNVNVAGIFLADNHMEARPDGSALAYSIEGTAQGAPFRIDVAFTDAGAELTLVQGGVTQNMTLPSEAPLYVVDNNFLEGFQLMADQVMASGEQQVFTALVPQVAAQATLGVSAPKAGTVEYRGSTLDVTQLDVAYVVGGQTLTMQLFLDADGHILVLEQQPGAVRFVRHAPEAGASGAPAEESDASADERAEKADAELADKATAQPVTAEAALRINAQCLMEQELSVRSTGETLVGRLTLPVSATLEGGAPAPTLLLLPGSGAVDMDGNALPFITNAMYKQLAFELACNGYGLLRVAKLGIAPSSGDANAVTLATYAQNAADWLALLAEQPGVDPNRLGLIGHSEGGLISLYTVAEGYAAPAVVVLLASPGRPLDAVLREQLLASFTRSGITGAALTELERQTDEAIAAIHNVEGTALVLEGDLAENQIAASFAHAAGLLRSMMAVDPAELAAEVGAPTLVAQGLKDVQITQADSGRLQAALASGTLLEFANMGHSFNHVPGDPESGMLPRADEVVSPTLVRALTTWLHGHLRTAH